MFNQTAFAMTTLRRTARRLLHAPVYAVTVVLTLGVAIGVSGAIFSLVHSMLLQPLPYPEPAQLAQLRHEASRVELPMSGVSPGIAEYYQQQSRAIESLGVYIQRNSTLTDLEPERVTVALVTPELISALNPSVVRGRVLASLDFELGGERKVLLSHALWVRRYSADPEIIGTTIEIDRNAHQVIGVADPSFAFPDPNTQAWIAWGWPEQIASRASLRGLVFGNVVRLRTGTSHYEAERELNELIGHIPEIFPEVTPQELDQMGLNVKVIPLREAIIGDVQVALTLLLGSAALLLLISWVNVGSIAWVRSERLRRDAAVARALGATRAHVSAEFVTEAVVLSVFASGLALALTAAAVNLRFGFAPDAIPRMHELELDWIVVAVIIGLSVLSAAMLALVTIATTTRHFESITSVGGSMSRGTANSREFGLRQTLVTVQVALAFVLLFGSALMARSYHELEQVRLGFDPQGVLTFRLPIPPGEYSNYHASAALHGRVLERLRSIPGVEAVEAGHASTFPLTHADDGYDMRLVNSDVSRSDSTAAQWGRLGFATPGYFNEMRIPILRGRTFQWGDTGETSHGIILSHSLSRALFGDQDPIGRSVRWATAPGPNYVVVGIVGDVVGERIEDGPSGAFYFPNVSPPQAGTITGVVHDYIPFDEVYAVRTVVPIESLLPTIQRAIHDVDPKLAITSAAPLARVVTDSVARVRLTLLLLFMGASVAVLLAMLGIYGMLSYVVSLRRPELGIRIALGARPASVAWTVVRHGAVPVAGGIVIGTAIAVACSRFLRAVVYEISPTDPIVLGMMAVALVAVALFATYFPARRAATIDPAQVLRE